MTIDERLKLLEHYLALLESTIADKELLSNYLQGLILVIAGPSDAITTEVIQRLQTFLIYFQNNFQEDNLRSISDD